MSLPSVVLDHMSQLDDELSLFVLLTAFKRVLLENTQRKKERKLDLQEQLWTKFTLEAIEIRKFIPIFFELLKHINKCGKDMSEYTS